MNEENELEYISNVSNLHCFSFNKFIIRKSPLELYLV